MTAAPSPQHATLSAGQIHEFEFDKDYDRVEILNVTGSAAVYATVDGTDPDVDAAGSQVLPAAIGSVEVKVNTAGNTIVKVKSLGTPKVSVRGLP